MPSKAAARTRLGLPPERNVLLFFGLIRPYKGLGYLIEAMPQVLKSLDCSLLVAGEFYDDKSKYTKLIDAHQLGPHVRLEDKYISNEEVAVYFAAADVVVLPYVEASQSGIVPIAYSFNTPVISTRVGGLPEAVIDGQTGFLVDPGSPERLAEADTAVLPGWIRARSSAMASGHAQSGSIVRRRFATSSTLQNWRMRASVPRA